MKEKAENIIRITLDDKQAARHLTTAETEQLARLDAMPDSAIDFSDIPELNDDWFARAAKSNAMRLPTKRQVSLRLDEDVLDFFKSHGARYQTRINAVLKAYMGAHKQA